ncbi:MULTISPECIES: gamma-glutamylcyclotransferase family protein [Methylomonas]|uniref:Gamma-glutamylcyclotransferase AIG2-like domain-containing protein n=1 Tax=Methylomonas koyamae TaxID=702114 RepID=A0A177N0E7_9GAMM|nr:gamma-glutamylcyclotransferase family protein [Methylomonas koyamae]OAI11331.1 hypothetical protein A1355_16275 [Methylomonas koyamae]
MPETNLPLFVYGSLRSDCGPAHQDFLSAATALGPASLTGALYDVGRYPAAVIGDAMYLIHGELYDLRGDTDLLACLDAYEECSAEFPEPREYRREIVEVTQNQRIRPAWAYLYNRPTQGLPRIESGDYRQYLTC